MKRFTQLSLILLNVLVGWAQESSRNWMMIKPERLKGMPAEAHRIWEINDDPIDSVFFLGQDFRWIGVPISDINLFKTERIHHINEIFNYTYSLYTFGNKTSPHITMDFFAGYDKVLMRLVWDDKPEQEEIYSVTCHPDSICIDGFYQGPLSDAQNAPTHKWTKMPPQTLYYVSGNTEGFCYAPTDAPFSKYLFKRDDNTNEKKFKASKPLKYTLDSLQAAIRMKEANERASQIPQEKNPPIVVVESGLYLYETNAPAFPGGKDAFKKWLQERTGNSDRDTTCHVYAQFTIRKDGALEDVDIIKAPNQELAQVAKRILLDMPIWKPAKVRGKTVQTKMILPIALSPNKSYSHYIEQPPAHVIEEVDENPIYSIVEENPRFPGGEEACMLWLAENIVYPETCIEQGIQGRVYAQFVIEKDGSLTNIKVVKSPHLDLSEEAIRVLANMPQWKPGRQRGKAVRVKFSLPVNFRLPTPKATKGKP